MLKLGVGAMAGRKDAEGDERSAASRPAARKTHDSSCECNTSSSDILIQRTHSETRVFFSVLAWLDRRPAGEPRATIIDLCSGVGYLSILLGELLGLAGRERVERLVLVDLAFPLLNMPPSSKNINPAHLNLADFWPIELTYRKYNLTKATGQRMMEQHVLQRSEGPVLLLGVHLCGVLSLRYRTHQHPQTASLHCCRQCSGCGCASTCYC